MEGGGQDCLGSHPQDWELLWFPLWCFSLTVSGNHCGVCHPFCSSKPLTADGVSCVFHQTWGVQSHKQVLQPPDEPWGRDCLEGRQSQSFSSAKAPCVPR